ncbi:multiple coagulation factor deficiency protein 2-like [Acanthaster planci]|uniref:Multiple coagulation factor deficiency protein 2-like n=1 Tax=Acanthaster planci TaxID=133434 RepID=A0A8B7YTT6_ACAPL|nr:multiple coagulation factor deficiency protein 2-like [Acanthaster planci]
MRPIGIQYMFCGRDFVLLVAFTLLLTSAITTSSQAQEKKSKFHDPEMVRNKEHVQEHLEELTGGQKREEDMTDEELEFHYFKLHDFDNNTKLDGLEILAAINHVMGDDKPSLNMTPEQAREIRLLEHMEMIDQVLAEDDFNNDGYLTYLEFVLARRRSEKEAEKYKQTKE